LITTGTTYVTLDRELCGNVRFKTVHDRAVGHITMAELTVVTTKFTIQRNICCTSGCQLQLLYFLMMGTESTRNM
jgi:hypothetical protein